MNRACFPKEKTPEFTKMGEIHELFVLALSLVWFGTGATPEKRCRTTGKKALAYRRQGGQNTDTASLALRSGVVLYLPTIVLKQSFIIELRWAKTRGLKTDTRVSKWVLDLF